MKLKVNRTRARALAGFTLIEILLVIVIILMLAGALVIFVLPQQEGAEKNTTKLLLSQVEGALDNYRLNVGHYPTEDEGGLNALLVKPTFENERLKEKWSGPYLKPGTKLEDSWGQPLRYEPIDRTQLDPDQQTSAPYKLFSAGPDGQPDTDDDITSVTGSKNPNDPAATTTTDATSAQ
ncbi:MAG: type II secretion system major pseudopilin GspG [Verrucomicrobiales bacterium]